MGITNKSKNDGIATVKNFIANMDSAVIDTALEQVTAKMVVDARSKAPVKTGYLRDHISNKKAGEGHWQVKSEASYSGFVEYGTFKMDAQPFLEPSVLSHVNDMDKVVKLKAERVIK